MIPRTMPDWANAAASLIKPLIRVEALGVRKEAGHCAGFKEIASQHRQIGLTGTVCGYSSTHVMTKQGQVHFQIDPISNSVLTSVFKQPLPAVSFHPAFAQASAAAMQASLSRNSGRVAYAPFTSNTCRRSVRVCAVQKQEEPQTTRRCD